MNNRSVLVYAGNAAELPKLQLGAAPDVVTDQTSARSVQHSTGMSEEEAQCLTENGGSRRER